MSRPFVLGVTGGIGAGKSTVTAHLASGGIPVFDCDAEVAAIYGADAFLRALRAEFGDLGADVRSAMVRAVLADPSALDRLYRLVEPFLRARWEAFLASNGPSRVVVLDAPLLLEKGWDGECDRVLCIMTDRAERLRRVLATRPGMTEEKFDAVDGRQVTDAARRERAHILVDGARPVAEVRASVDDALARLGLT